MISQIEMKEESQFLHPHKEIKSKEEKRLLKHKSNFDDDKI